MAFQVGDTIGDYRIESVLGEGGMGQVFRVRNLLSDRVEAMKIVLPRLDGDERLPERFLREIRVLASLDHPHIVAMRTALRVENRVALVMELVDGVSLYKRLRTEGLVLNNALRYAGQVLGALGYAHTRGVVHRDIKPDNILVTGAGIAKLTDFGVAFFAGDRSLTSTGAAVGSLHYMSPEQVRGGEVDGRSDLYSVGITLYELTTGKRAIQGDSSWSVMNGHLNQTPVPPIEINPSLSRDLSDAILRALAKSPGDRFQTAEEFRAALGEDAVTVSRLPDFIARTPAGPTAAPLTSEQIVKLESAIVRAVGPIGKQLVARAVRSNSSLPAVCQSLAENIPDAKEREAFLRTWARETPTPPSRTSQLSNMPTAPMVERTPTASPTPLEAELLRTVKQKLAVHLGPIANIMVDRAARTARSPRELYEALAKQIPTDTERQAFLRSLPR
ncbi:MAG TPA: protein kinase [Bryobacteraceae bacterium]|nr:protein kinase [Bryobacteraceae bacterium]